LQSGKSKDTGNLIIKDEKITHKKYQKLKIEFLTVHRSKGLEADNVIILNMKNDKLGFPNKIADDPLLQLLLPAKDNYAYAEERRLFYVAITRTKNKTFLMVPDRGASEFANEIKSLCHLEISNSEKLAVNNPKCPICRTGRLVLRQTGKSVILSPFDYTQGKLREGSRPCRNLYFTGCSNFPSCTFTSKDTSIIENPIACSGCGGFMVERRGQHGRFLGCTNYPECKKTGKV